jgi:hypothetical protein
MFIYIQSLHKLVKVHLLNIFIKHYMFIICVHYLVHCVIYNKSVLFSFLHAHNTMVIEKKVKMTNNDLQNTTQKTKIGHHKRHWIPRRTQVNRKDNQLFVILTFFSITIVLCVLLFNPLVSSNFSYIFR